MSRASRNFLIAYVLLVGLPLLGLAGILKAGSRLSAPLSIEGAWKVDVHSGLASQACLNSLSDSPLLIAQSGGAVVVSAGGANGSGTLNRTHLQASLRAPQAASSPCGPGITITATVDPKAEPRMLAGTAVPAGCSNCAPIQFHAVRTTRGKSTEIH